MKNTDRLILSEEEQMKVVLYDPSYIRYIENPCEGAQLHAVGMGSGFIEHIENPSEAAQIVSVKMNGRYICYIKNPSRNVQLAAVSGNDASAIGGIDNPDEEIQMIAVRKHLDAFSRIRKGQATKQVKLYAIRKSASRDAVSAIQFIDDPELELQMIAVKLDKDALNYIKSPAPEAVDFVVKEIITTADPDPLSTAIFIKQVTAASERKGRGLR